MTLKACLTMLALLAAGSAQAADLDYGRTHHARSLTVTPVAMVVDCTPIPTIVAPGRRGMGEPGTFYARWDYRLPPGCR
jgi:hypothetical protein